VQKGQKAIGEKAQCSSCSSRWNHEISYKVIVRFLKAGVTLKEDIIKLQHKCKATGFWVKKSKLSNFLPHEPLQIFEHLFAVIVRDIGDRSEVFVRDDLHPAETENAVIHGLAHALKHA